MTNAYAEYQRHKNDPETIAALKAFSAHMGACNKCHDHGRRGKRCDAGWRLEQAYNRAYNTAHLGRAVAS
jgi:hypothetical protein